MRYMLGLSCCLLVGCTSGMSAKSATVPAAQLSALTTAHASSGPPGARAGQTRAGQTRATLSSDDEAEQAPMVRTKVTRSYRLHVAVADVVSTGVGALVFATRDGGERAYALVPIILGPSIAHMVNRNEFGAGMSIVVRAGAPVAGLLGGLIIALAAGAQCDQDEQPEREYQDCRDRAELATYFAVFGGLVSGHVLDYVLLAEKTEYVLRPAPTSAGITVRPAFGYSQRGVTLGLQGRF